MSRLLGFIVAICFIVSGLVTGGAAPAQAQDDLPSIQGKLSVTLDDPAAEAAAEIARLLSRLEAKRDFDRLYDLLHPDAKAIVPREAVVGWYSADLANKHTAELTVTSVNLVEWVWPVTGQVYGSTAEVGFSQPYWIDDVRTEVAAVVHLVKSDDGWGWFFGANRAFVDEQIALYAPDYFDSTATDRSRVEQQQRDEFAQREARFPDRLHAHVDAFWARQFAVAGHSYQSPRGVVGFAEQVKTPCGRADPETEAAFYCVPDETIYYSVTFRQLVEREIGDFGWVVVVAHEWGHHIQHELGYSLGTRSDSTGEFGSRAMEQQADCLAGAYTHDAEQTGWLDPGDVDEALYMTRISGDPPGTAEDDPLAHGSSEERVDAFLTGYEDGIPACDLGL